LDTQPGVIEESTSMSKEPDDTEKPAADEKEQQGRLAVMS
jgi:hypothetical protein